MELSDKDIGRNVQDYRYKRGLNQGELAQMVGLDRSALSRIETGIRPLNALELARIAASLGIDVSRLLTRIPQTAAPDLTRTLLRSGPVTADDYGQLNWFMETFEPIIPLVEAPAILDRTERARQISPIGLGELVARRARSRLDLDPAAPVEGFSGLIMRAGLMVAVARLPSRSRLSGCLIADDAYRGAVLINSNHDWTRQRYTLAHELGHHLMHETSFATACDAGEVRPGPRSLTELQADMFAAAFLLPKRALSGLRRPVTYEAIRNLTDNYGLSLAGVLSRLRALRLLSTVEARVIQKTGGPTHAVRPVPAYRLVSETASNLLQRLGMWPNTDKSSVQVVADAEVIP